MKKKLLAIFVICMSNAWAGFTYVTENEDAKFYVDTDTIKKVNKKVKFWSLKNLNSPKQVGNDPPYQSTKSLEATDCELETRQNLYSIFYSGLNGNGHTVFTIDEAQKETPIIPDTTGASVHRFVCNFKDKR